MSTLLLATLALLAAMAAAAAALATSSSATPVHAAAPQVLRVGTYNGIRGQFSSIQAAVNAAHPGDWILVAPGDYHEQGVSGASEPAGVLITTPRLHLRGMDRNSVIVDGTKPGASTCSARLQDQQITSDGRDGVEVLKADGDYVENLTVCNYLTSSDGKEGNEIWFNGGDGSGKIGMGPWWGNWITATSTYSNGVNPPFGQYGIFTSNSNGPGSYNHAYASNMGDAGFYVGACPDCNTTLDDVHTQFSALGFSGTNAGGNMVIENSEFDNNKTGPTQDSENNDDAPPPQNGHCPGNAAGPMGTGVCDIWRNNYIHDNNNPNVPGNSVNGLAGAAPVGAGVVNAGTEYIGLYHNRIVRNNSWGVLITDQPYMGQPPPVAHCEGGIYVSPPPSPNPTCYFQAFGNEVASNFFQDNGGYHNPSNGDIGLVTTAHNPGNCFHDNTDPGGLTSDPPAIQSGPFNPCGQPNGGDISLQTFEALCATQLVFPCPAGIPLANYPHAGKVVLHMPPPQPTMPDPCAGVPANPWCQGNGLPSARRCIDRRGFSFLLHKNQHGRIVKVSVFVNGKRLRTRRGHDIGRIRISRLPKGKFVVRIVAVHADGTRVITTRTYRGCKKTKPRTRVKHRRGR